jgi:hypothetical protein
MYYGNLSTFGVGTFVSLAQPYQRLADSASKRTTSCLCSVFAGCHNIYYRMRWSGQHNGSMSQETGIIEDPASSRH